MVEGRARGKRGERKRGKEKGNGKEWFGQEKKKY